MSYVYMVVLVFKNYEHRLAAFKTQDEATEFFALLRKADDEREPPMIMSGSVLAVKVPTSSRLGVKWPWHWFKRR